MESSAGLEGATCGVVCEARFRALPRIRPGLQAGAGEGGRGPSRVGENGGGQVDAAADHRRRGGDRPGPCGFFGGAGGGQPDYGYWGLSLGTSAATVSPI